MAPTAAAAPGTTTRGAALTAPSGRNESTRRIRLTWGLQHVQAESTRTVSPRALDGSLDGELSTAERLAGC